MSALMNEVKMDKISELMQKKTTPTGWEFVVTISGTDHFTTTHEVVVDNEYYHELTDGRITPKELVRRSIEFLLKKESKESILPSFNLREISDYFPDFENSLS